MDLLKLDPTTFNPIDIVEGHTSLIWIERFLPFGEFEFKTFDIDRVLAKITLNDLVGERGCAEVMLIDTLEINLTDEGDRELTVKGLSFENILKYRNVYGGENSNKGKTWRVAHKYTAAEFAALLVSAHIVVTDDYPSLTSSENDITYISDAKDMITNVRVSNSTTLSDKREYWRLGAGDVYQYIEDALTGGEAMGDEVGIRNIRPPYATAKIQDFAADGTPSKTTLTPIVNRLLIDFYNGRDKTSTVVFRHDEGHLDEISYLWSLRDRSNVHRTDSPDLENGNASAGGIITVARQGVNPNTISGIYRRVSYSVGKALPTPGDTQPIGYPEIVEIRQREGRRALRKEPPLGIIDAKVSALAPFKYGVDYRLGDIVTVKGEYGSSASMRVDEVVRSEDSDGEVTIPSLIQI